MVRTQAAGASCPVSGYGSDVVKRALVILCLLAVAATASAHERFKIAGSIVTVHATQLDVTAVDGATYEIDMNESTQVMRELKKVPQSELRAGQ